MSDSKKQSDWQPATAVILLSGGLDSAVTLAIAQEQGYIPIAMSFDYGQRHRVELEAARQVAKAAGVVDHRVVVIDSAAFGGFRGSALVDQVPVPKDRHLSSDQQVIPVTYVPARNTIFLSFALGLAEVVGSSAIFIGVNAVDYSGYPDCRPEFIRSYEQMANLATKAGVEGRLLRIQTPLLNLSKVQIIQRGLALGVDFGLTHSCYDPIDDRDCGHCDACQLRQEAFRQLGMDDPALKK